MTPVARIGLGHVHHARLRPRRHAFTAPTWFVWLPMRAWRAGASIPLARNRRAVAAFHDRDHGLGGPDALAWIESLLAAQGITDADGEVWLQTYPRVLGFVFKPVSFWHCERTDGSLAAIVAEVNNTFGERHCYVLPAPAYGREQTAGKVFHVSPFCAVEGRYRFRFLRTAGRLVARVDHDDRDGALLSTGVGGRLVPLTRATLRAALLRMPLLTLGVVARIHWHALRLWLKGVPLHAKPTAPTAFTTR